MIYQRRKGDIFRIQLRVRQIKRVISQEYPFRTQLGLWPSIGTLQKPVREDLREKEKGSK